MAKLEAKLGMIVDSVGQFFSGKDQLPWSYHDWLSNSLGCEREVAEAGKQSSDETLQECLLRLSWALVHSKRPEDVQRGIAMLEASLPSTNDPLQQREKLYLLAVGHYRSGDYSRSRDLVERCLMIAPDWRQAVTLKKAIEERITKDGVIGLGIAATAVGLIAGGIAAAVSRRK
ncbi:Tetratricopeptide-like helical domain superfamily [Sesbania bispinosa]|nr:Tetratricopeptide-like helical domain superfamily [Sesbania bispinosa]